MHDKGTCNKGKEANTRYLLQRASPETIRVQMPFCYMCVFNTNRKTTEMFTLRITQWELVYAFLVTKRIYRNNFFLTTILIRLESMVLKSLRGSENRKIILEFNRCSHQHQGNC